MKKFGIPNRRRILRLLAQTIAAVSLVLFTGSAMAGTLSIYLGLDDAVPVTGPFANGAASQLLFLTAASAFGTTSTITFEGLPTGFTTSPVTVAPGVTMTQTGSNAGAGLSGISNASFSPGFDFYGFNTTPGGSYFLAVSGNATTFDFATPTNSFGFHSTGLQRDASAMIVLAFDDGTAQTIHFTSLPTSGGAEYFGFTDTTAFSSITVTDIPSSSVGTDDWGIDDVSYDRLASTTTATIPEPSSILLISTGALTTIAAIRRKGRPHSV